MGRAKVICYSVAVTVGGDVGMRRRIWLLTSAPDDDDSDNDGNEKSIRGGVGYLRHMVEMGCYSNKGSENSRGGM